MKQSSKTLNKAHGANPIFEGDEAKCAIYVGLAEAVLWQMVETLPQSSSKELFPEPGVEIYIKTFPNHIRIKAGGGGVYIAINAPDGDPEGSGNALLFNKADATLPAPYPLFPGLNKPIRAQSTQAGFSSFLQQRPSYWYNEKIDDAISWEHDVLSGGTGKIHYKSKTATFANPHAACKLLVPGLGNLFVVLHGPVTPVTSLKLGIYKKAAAGAPGPTFSLTLVQEFDLMGFLPVDIEAIQYAEFTADALTCAFAYVVADQPTIKNHIFYCKVAITYAETSSIVFSDLFDFQYVPHLVLANVALLPAPAFDGNGQYMGSKINGNTLYYKYHRHICTSTSPTIQVDLYIFTGTYNFLTSSHTVDADTFHIANAYTKVEVGDDVTHKIFTYYATHPIYGLDIYKRETFLGQEQILPYNGMFVEIRQHFRLELVMSNSGAETVLDSIDVDAVGSTYFGGYVSYQPWETIGADVYLDISFRNTPGAPVFLAYYAENNVAMAVFDVFSLTPGATGTETTPGIFDGVTDLGYLAIELKPTGCVVTGHVAYPDPAITPVIDPYTSSNFSVRAT